MKKDLIKLYQYLKKSGSKKEASLLARVIQKEAEDKNKYEDYKRVMRRALTTAKDPNNPDGPLSDTFRRGAEEIGVELNKVKDWNTLNYFITKYMYPRKDKYPWNAFYQESLSNGASALVDDLLSNKKGDQSKSTSVPKGKDIGWAIITNIENTDLGVKSVSGQYSQKLVSMKKYKKLRNPDGSPKKFKYTYNNSRAALENTLIDLNKNFDFGKPLASYDSEPR